MQGESYDEEVLNALMKSRPVMVLFRSPRSLTELVTSIQAYNLPSLQYLDVVERSLSQIQDWFDDNLSHTFGEIMRKLPAIMSDGKAVFLTGSTIVDQKPGAVLEIHYTGFKHSREVSQVMTEDHLAVS